MNKAQIVAVCKEAAAARWAKKKEE